MSMLQKVITSGSAVAYPSQWYWQDTNWRAKTVTGATDRYTIESPDAVQVDVGGVSLTQYSKQTLDLSLDTNWDVGQNIGTWAAEHTYAVGDLVRPTSANIADGSNNANTAYATSAANANVMANGVTISASSEYASTWAAWKAFEQTTGLFWNTANTSFPHWLKYDFGSGKNKVINKFRFNNYNGTGPKRWKLQASNIASPSTADGADWTDLYTEYVAQDFAEVGDNWTNYFTFNNPTPYRHYRIYITATHNSGDNEVVIRELHLVEQLPLVYRASAITTGISSETEPSWAITGDTTDTGVTWTAYTDYTGAMARSGKDFYVYAVARAEGSVPKFLLSANSTVPTGYTANTSRKIAGFHCLCLSVGTISGHDLTGYVTGDILPTSVWDLNKKSMATNGNIGQVYDDDTLQWVGIYPVSGSVSVPTIVYGGTILVSEDWNNAVDAGKVLGMKLPTDAGFQSLAAGSNEITVINGGAAPSPFTSIGYSTSARRMISNIGCESCCGLVWHWLDEQSYQFRTPPAHYHAITTVGTTSGPARNITNTADQDLAPAWGWQAASGSKGSIYRQGTTTGGDVKVLAGGDYEGQSFDTLLENAIYCGSRARDMGASRWSYNTRTGFRLIANSIEK